MTLRHLLPLLLALALVGNPTARSSELSPEQLQSLKDKLEALKQNLHTHLNTRNTNASQTFANAAGDPKAAVELYLNCVKAVEYDRQGRPESDFKAWRDGQSDRLRDTKFIESLQLQLRYLALSCQAAESSDISSLFGPLMVYVDSLSHLSEMPQGPITQPVGGSVFAKAYYLDRTLSSSKSWEPIPINIGGIYEKTIFPYLREKNTGALMNAWDKRIEQQTRLVTMLDQKKSEEMRGLNRDEGRKARNAQANQGGALKEHAVEEFRSRTLPQLQWGKLKDMFLHVDQANGAAAMLQFVDANLTRELGEQFYTEFEELIKQIQQPGNPAGTN